MNKFFYTRLATNNIKKNGKTYIPFLITSVLTVAMFYILLSLSQNKGLSELKIGSKMVPEVLKLGCWIVGIFSVIFLFYTYSFLMKRRQKEFGLFNILGMEKKHIAKIIALETLYTALISIVVGLLVGMLLDKLMYMILLRIVNVQFNINFYISVQPISITVILFGFIFALLFLYSMFRVRLTNPIQLLHGCQVGEKEPKTKIVMAIIGLLCLGIGYYLSISTRDASDAIGLFFIAVIFVIIGTYFLFIAGSIALFKMLRKNKKYYYKTNHFISISGMIYRMKKNAVGLANICILSTMVLVMLSTTLSMMIGLDDTLNFHYPYDISFHSYSDTESEKANSVINNVIDKNNLILTKEVSYKSITYSNFNSEKNPNLDSESDYTIIRIIPVSEYNKCYNQNKSIKKNEVLLYTNIENFSQNSIRILEKDYTISDKLIDIDNTFSYNLLYGDFFILIINDDEFKSLDEQMTKDYKLDNVASEDYELHSVAEYWYHINLSGSDEEKLAVCNELTEYFNNNQYIYSMACRSEAKMEILSIYGSLFFIAIFLGTLFVVAMILIIYYKQISEGYEDRERFDIMQKVGLSYAEAKKAIRSQILTVFFLPLITAGIHIVFAFPMISRILSFMTLSEEYMTLDNVQLYIWCTAVCFVVFALLYLIIYIATARTYYRIVKWKNTSNKD